MVNLIFRLRCSFPERNEFVTYFSNTILLPGLSTVRQTQKLGRVPFSFRRHSNKR